MSRETVTCERTDSVPTVTIEVTCCAEIERAFVDVVVTVCASVGNCTVAGVASQSVGTCAVVTTRIGRTIVSQCGATWPCEVRQAIARVVAVSSQHTAAAIGARL